MTTRAATPDPLAHYHAHGASRDEMARGGLKAFFAMTAEWGLDDEARRILLGNPGRTRYYKLKALQESPKLSDDELGRLSHLINIHAALRILYSSGNAVAWLTHIRAQDSHTPWRGSAPLDYMLTGHYEHIADVARYLDGLRGAA
ncbi:uncharacterized protein FOKN1_0432 [Thiohalobacter thiocyanaticus]|uniref:DUF2384 domain-containing protein n=1 Tax=Thiohalobacter thiocyanaticus TaxID=585455 RepID=A0A1Z4VMI3_9GAMM|nr:DUF2384 domain-containing protein [Thiohalobacter thiocyanaticus]BAZ92836.1 uncharacterized protein FOKN1_0432 [Thiohalobacter thiocyanaticus]